MEIFLYNLETGEILFFITGGVFSGTVILLLVYIISNGGIGGGDVKLFAVIGSYVGGASVLRIMLYSMCAFLCVCLPLICLGKMKMKEMIPMAPFVLAGMTVEMIFC